MEEKEISYPKNSQKSARRFRIFRLLVFAALAFGLMLFLFGALVSYDMRRPVTPPPFILPGDLTTASLALFSDTPATPLLQSSQSTTSTLVSTPASTATLLASASPQPPPPPAARDLLPEAAFPSPEKRQAARKINDAFRQLQKDFAILQQEEKKREDPDIPSDKEMEVLKKIYGSYRQIVAKIRQNFDSRVGEHFEKVFLGMLIGNRDWRLATWHCVMLEKWDSALYCARRIEPREERPVTIAFCSGARALARIRDLLHRP